MDLFSKKGYDLPLAGSPSNVLQSLSFPRKINLVPSDFPGIKPKLLVKEGDSLIKGQPVYFDKNNPNIMFTTFFSGNVNKIIYGPRRSILKINISTVNNNDQIPFSSYDLNDIVNEILKRGDKNLLLSVINKDNRRRYLGVKLN